MKNAIVFSALAEKEIEASFTWYEGESSGLGERFVAVLDKAFDLIRRSPDVFLKKRDNYREMVVEIFPFVVIYEYIENQDAIYVLHVFHTSRDPKMKYRKR